MFDTKLKIEDFEFFVSNNGYSFEMELEDDTTLEAQIFFIDRNIGGEVCEFIDYIEVVSEHSLILDDTEIEEIEEILSENIHDIFRTARSI
jgi:hypothetical protein